ncbi:hypothetical protein RRG08_063060, partial [Elysia crispata]
VPLAGKDRAVACGSLQLLKDMLTDSTKEVRANAAGAIMTSRGQTKTSEHVEKIRDHENDHIAAVAKAAKIAVKFICSENQARVKLLVGKFHYLFSTLSPGYDLRFTTVLDFCSVSTGNEIFCWRPG